MGETTYSSASTDWAAAGAASTSAGSPTTNGSAPLVMWPSTRDNARQIIVYVPSGRSSNSIDITVGSTGSTWLSPK